MLMTSGVETKSLFAGARYCGIFDMMCISKAGKVCCNKSSFTACLRTGLVCAKGEQAKGGEGGGDIARQGAAGGAPD